MYAVVLVGGFGTRLRPLTNDVPKPMLPVAQRPMIHRLVERLAEGGVTDVVLALGFKPEPFVAAFPDGAHAGVNIVYAVEPEPLDTAGAIAFAARHAGVDDTFVVANGDIITDLPVADLVDVHRAREAQVTIHLTPVADPAAFGVVELDDAGMVVRFVEKPSPGETSSNLVNAGTYVVEPDVLDLIEPGRKISVERDTFPRLVSAGTLAALPTDHYWIDAGRPELYLQANLDLVRGDPSLAIHPAAHVDPSSTIVESVVGDGARVAGDCAITRSVLLAGAVIERGVTLVDSIVGGHVGAGARVTSSVIASGYRIGDGCLVTGELLPRP